MKKYHLDDMSLNRFRKDGFLGPLPLIDREEMVRFRSVIELILKKDSCKSVAERKHNRHLDNSTIYDLASHPGIVDRISSIYGRDLLLWRTNFFVKNPGSKEIPWHQDHNYWPLEPPIVASAWIAIDDSTKKMVAFRFSRDLIVPYFRIFLRMMIWNFRKWVIQDMLIKPNLSI